MTRPLNQKDKEIKRARAQEGLKKANDGDPAIQYELGIFLTKGRYLPHDNEEAFRWFEESSKQGFSKASMALVPMLSLGMGCKQDLSRASSILKSMDGEYKTDKMKDVVKTLMSQRKG